MLCSVLQKPWTTRHVRVNSENQKTKFEVFWYWDGQRNGFTFHICSDARFKRGEGLVIAGGTTEDIYNEIRRWLDKLLQEERKQWIVIVLYHSKDFCRPTGVASWQSDKVKRANHCLEKMGVECAAEAFNIKWQGPAGPHQWFKPEALLNITPTTTVWQY